MRACINLPSGLGLPAGGRQSRTNFSPNLTPPDWGRGFWNLLWRSKILLFLGSDFGSDEIWSTGQSWLTRVDDEGSLGLDPALIGSLWIADLTHAPVVVISEKGQNFHSADGENWFDNSVVRWSWKLSIGNGSAVAFPRDFVSILKYALQVDRLLRLEKVVLLLGDDDEFGKGCCN